MNNLGDMYANGRGVDQDYGLARAWYEKAAAGGSGAAMSSLGDLYKHGNGVPKDLLEAQKWYTRAAAAGDKDAARQLKRLAR